jgi:putative effector of murein hydrolase LrgA (UPF0299 family)
MDLARFLQIYVVQGGFAIFFLYMAIIILKRGKKRTNLYLSGFYLFSGVGGIINIIYANIFEETIVYVLHFTTYYMFCFAMAFVLVFVLIIVKPTNRFRTKTQFFILSSFGILLFGLLFIPNGIIINPSTNWKPNWSWGFFIYSIIISTFIVIIPTSYYSIRIYTKFENQHLKKKWKYFLIGVSAYFFLYYGTSLSNTLNNDTFRLIWSLISLPTLVALYLIYYGVGRQLE